jgi:voltage-gated potassium channel
LAEEGGMGPEAELALQMTSVARPTPRERAHAILEEGETGSRIGLAVEVLLLVLIVGNVLTIMLETVPSVDNRYHRLLDEFETFTVYIFALEYVIRLWCSVEDPRVGSRRPLLGRLRYAARPMMIVDLLSFLPFLLLGAFGGAALALRSFRILRLLRLLKIARYSPAVPALLGVLYAERRALTGTLILLLCVLCLSGELMRLTEGSVQPNVFGTLPDGMYWAMTTLATVGYGDKVPVTMLGRLIAGLTMVTGLVLFAMPIGIIATGFVDSLQRREFSVTWSMVKRQPLFAGFAVDAVNEFLDLVGAKLVQDHSRIAVAGQHADTFYLIVSGRARAEDADRAWDLGAGDLVGEEALDETGRYGVTVTTMTEMRLMVLSGGELRRLTRKFPLLEQRIKRGKCQGNMARGSSFAKGDTLIDHPDSLDPGPGERP